MLFPKRRFRPRTVDLVPVEGVADGSADAKNVGKVDVKGVRLLVNQPTTLDLTVKLAGQTTTIEVRGEAPTVNTQDATIGIPGAPVGLAHAAAARSVG